MYGRSLATPHARTMQSVKCNQSQQKLFDARSADRIETAAEPQSSCTRYLPSTRGKFQCPHTLTTRKQKQIAPPIAPAQTRGTPTRYVTAITIAPASAAVAYTSARNTVGTCASNTSRIVPPPTPLIVPNSTATSGFIPYTSAFRVPTIANSDSPAASRITIEPSMCRSIGRCKQKTIAAPANAVAAYRQSFNEAGGTSPINKSRMMPPPSAVANANTIKPIKSRFPRTAATAPSIANISVPAISAANSARSPPLSSTPIARPPHSLLVQIQKSRRIPRRLRNNRCIFTSLLPYFAL